ncbi:MAG: SpoIIE family protein phosphatase [Ignavibacteriota bacterium]
MLQTTFGLLLPIALLRPRIRKSWVFFALMPLFSVLPATLTAGDEALWATFLTLQLAIVAAVFVPFFTCDLLAAISGIFALRFVGALIGRSAVSPAWQHIFIWEVAPAGVAFLLAQVYFAFRGPTYEEFEVRPRYARFLAEHQALEAEIGAARLAQLRLLPAAPPHLDGLSIAGGCVPAREVGGDFYDFYEIDSHRLAVFLAEGGSRELGSAMPIALAKGYLLYASGLDLSPAELLRRLSGVMGKALHGDASMSVLYAVIDARARTVRFARTGDSPRLLVNGNAVAEEVAGDDGRIRHGVATLALNDALFFYTDGLARQIVERRHQWTDKFLQKLTRKWPTWTAVDLQNSVLRSALRGKQQPPDDVTLVVIRMVSAAQRAMEVVA